MQDLTVLLAGKVTFAFVCDWMDTMLYVSCLTVVLADYRCRRSIPGPKSVISQKGHYSATNYKNESEKCSKPKVVEKLKIYRAPHGQKL